MRIRLPLIAVLIALGTADVLASHHDVKLRVISSITEGTTLADGGAWPSQTSIISQTGGPECPDGSTATASPNGTVTQCQWSNLGSSGTTKAKGTTVRAYLTTSTGEVFDISMFCSRRSGKCPEPKPGATYSAQLDDAPKYLANYAPRREFGPMKVKFSPDGKKSVSYSIIFSMRAGSHQTHPD